MRRFKGNNWPKLKLTLLFPHYLPFVHLTLREWNVHFVHDTVLWNDSTEHQAFLEARTRLPASSWNIIHGIITESPLASCLLVLNLAIVHQLRQYHENHDHLQHVWAQEAEPWHRSQKAGGCHWIAAHHLTLPAALLRNPVVLLPWPRPNCHEQNQRHFRRRSHWPCRRYEASKSEDLRMSPNGSWPAAWPAAGHMTNINSHHIPTYLPYPKPLTWFVVEGDVLVKACNGPSVQQRWIADSRSALWGEDSWSCDPRTRFENLANVGTCLKIVSSTKFAEANLTLDTQKYWRPVAKKYDKLQQAPSVVCLRLGHFCNQTNRQTDSWQSL